MIKVSFLINKRGSSLVEILLAVAIFGMFVTALAGSLLLGQEGAMTSGSRQRATKFAEEGVEAVKSIRDGGYSSLPVDGNYGLVISGGKWTLSGTSDTSGIFTRVVNLSTPSTGVRKITVTVTWAQNMQRNGSIALESYATDWLGTTSGGGGTPKKRGLLAYYDATGGRNTLTSRQYDDVANTFGVEEDIALGAGQNSRNIVLKTSPTKGEAVLAYGDNVGNLKVLCYDDTTDVWTQDFTATIGGTGTTKRFDVEYEKTTGDAVVVYSTNGTSTNQIATRTKSGSAACGTANWGAATNFSSARITTGAVTWVQAEAAQNSGTNNIGVAWASNTGYLSAGIWNGSTLANETPNAFSTATSLLEYVTAIGDNLAFDIAAESNTGYFMVVWSPYRSGTTACTAGATPVDGSCIKYSRFTTSWQAIAAIPTVADIGTNIDLAANPLSTSNEMALGAMDNGTGDSSHAYWSGSAWTGKANQDTAVQAPTAGSKRIACAWLNSGATSRSVCAYNDSATTNLGWVVGSAGTFTTQTDFTVAPVFASPQIWYDMDVNPNSQDTLMFAISDNGADLHLKRLVMTSTPAFTWTNTEGGAALETTLSQATSKPFGFAFWKVIPIADATISPLYNKKQDICYLNQRYWYKNV
jgi:Tfp pilus assembly protein PilV